MSEPMIRFGDPNPKIYFSIDHASRNFTFFGRDGSVIGTMDFSRIPAFEGSLDESAHLFFNWVANLWNNEVNALRAKLQAAEAYTIKCIWCGLKMATVDEAAEHVLQCDKGPWVALLSRAEAAEAERDEARIGRDIYAEEAVRLQAEVEGVKEQWERRGEHMRDWEVHCAKKNTRIAALEAALIRLRDCDWVITPADRMDAVRDIARTALLDGRDG